MTRRMVAAAALALAGLLLPLLAVPAAAHEDKKVAHYTFTVGFGDEPAYAGLPNSVQLLLANNGKPVTDLKDTLKVTVTTGDSEPKKMSLQPNFGNGWGERGDYRAFFIPTTPGAYTFHFTGTIKGKKIDKSLTSIKDGFDEVSDPAQVHYPAVEPSGAQLATRLDRESGRLNAALAAGRKQASDEVAGARRLAMISVFVGVLGLVAALAVGVLALRRRS